MTASDYEDMLQVNKLRRSCLVPTHTLYQCAIPVFEGLLPEPHNRRILSLLFHLAYWHGLAKLRMHTDRTLDLLSQATVNLGEALRAFKDNTCSVFVTRELERERAARQRREMKLAKGGAGTGPTASNISARKIKTFNLDTYKIHALGDYVITIRRFGAVGSYTSERVSPLCSALGLPLLTHKYQPEREHITSKDRFDRTSGREINSQMAKIEQRERRLSGIRERSGRSPPEKIVNDPQVQYNIGKTQNSPVHLPTFLQRNDRDPAIKVCWTLGSVCFMITHSVSLL